LNQETNNPGTPASPEAKIHKRRPRYSGRNPRHFHEKYKELQAEKHPDIAAKILAGGKTLAGTHRPICVPEILEILHPKPGDIALDATLGFGGHAAEILRAIQPGGKLLGMDVDPIELPKTEARLRSLLQDPQALVVRRSNFAGAARFINEEGFQGMDVILADLGLSSMQIDNPERGFTFKFDGPLDLRMNPQKGEPASAYLQKVGPETLASILVENSDEPYADAIATAIVEARERNPIHNTKRLSAIIHDCLKSMKRNDADVQSSQRRVFQALRIEVNDEFGALETFLRNLPSCLKAGGRAAILTFHSGEDRRVKKSFQNGQREGIYQEIADDIIRPSAEEVRSNPRASSAKLRWAIKASDSL